MPINILFCGSGEFCIKPFMALRAMCSQSESCHIAAILSQAAKPAGRGQQLLEPPLLQHFQTSGNPENIRIFQPAKLSQGANEIMTAINPDLIVVVDYGEFIPDLMLQQPRFGAINIHPSLLPRWRGAIPIQATILAGDSMTGVTIQQMAAKMDAGPILRQQSLEISPTATAFRLSAELSTLAATMLPDTINAMLAGATDPQTQNETLATYCYQDDLTKDKAHINWDAPTLQILNQIRAYIPYPIAWSLFRGSRLLIHQASASTQASGPELPGELVHANNQVFVRAQDGWLQLQIVQMAGKKQISGQQFVAGYQLQAKEFLS